MTLFSIVGKHDIVWLAFLIAVPFCGLSWPLRKRRATHRRCDRPRRSGGSRTPRSGPGKMIRFFFLDLLSSQIDERLLPCAFLASFGFFYRHLCEKAATWRLSDLSREDAERIGRTRRSFSSHEWRSNPRISRSTPTKASSIWGIEYSHFFLHFYQDFQLYYFLKSNKNLGFNHYQIIIPYIVLSPPFFLFSILFIKKEGGAD